VSTLTQLAGEDSSAVDRKTLTSTLVLLADAMKAASDEDAAKASPSVMAAFSRLRANMEEELIFDKIVNECDGQREALLAGAMAKVAAAALQAAHGQTADQHRDAVLCSLASWTQSLEETRKSGSRTGKVGSRKLK